MNGEAPNDAGPAVDPAVPAPPARESALRPDALVGDTGWPVRELDRALAPVRRTVRFAMEPGRLEAIRFLGANLDPHLRRALAADLPDELRERVQHLLAQTSGFDADALDGRARRLSELFAGLARIDALAGLPLREALRPVAKARQNDLPEADVARAPAEAARPTELRPEQPRDDDEEDDEEEDDDGPGEFVGDWSYPLADLLPGAPTEAIEALCRAGVVTLRDLALTRPVTAEHLTPVHGAGRELPPGRVAIGGRVRLGFTVFRAGATPRRGSVLVGAAPLVVEWAEPAPALWNERDRRVVVVGTRADPEAEPVAGSDRAFAEVRDAEVALAGDDGVRLASWALPGVSDRWLRDVWSGLADLSNQIRDPASPEPLRRLQLVGLGAALVHAHQQLDEVGRRRLAYDEVLLAQIAGIVPRLQPGRDRGLGHSVLHGFAAKVGQTHDLVLFDDAQQHYEEIKRDLRRSVPMRRVLTGEVGGAKGRIALFAAAMVADAKSQVAVIGSDPVEIEQRFAHAEPLLREGGLVARLVPPAPSRAQLDAIKRGEVHVLFGTPALLESPLEFRRLGLIVAFEHSAFGRVGVLHQNLPAPRPDLLVVTAVPVGPRTLLTAYADHHLSVVVDPDRRPAKITLCGPDRRGAAYERIREAVARGAQGLVVFPTVDGADALDIPEALRVVRALEGDALAGMRVGLLHGASSREERVRVHEDWVHRRLDVLVSTTRIEDGPAVPGAAVVVIEQADRVDQIRLHRIIGYMSRATIPAEAMLVVGETADEDAAAKIGRVLAAANGFELTEAWVSLRGVEATMAPGTPSLPQLRWFDLDLDLDLLLGAREEAHRILRADPQLRRGPHAELGRELRARWSSLFPDAASAGVECPIRDDAPVEPRKRRRRRRRRR
ncbi:MAG: helicase-related protein [Myxococcota bacterium]